MIKDIYSSSPFLTVNQYNNYNGGGNAAGLIRWSASSQSLETWDGFSWMPIGGNVDVSLTIEAQELLEWAREERSRQRRLEEKAKTNDTIRNALDRCRAAEEQLRIVEILCDESNEGASSNKKP